MYAEVVAAANDGGLDPLQLVNTVLTLGAGAIGSVLIYRNTKASNQTTRENSLVDQLQEQVQGAINEAKEAKKEASEARVESNRLRGELARMSTFAWQLYDHINRGHPPPPPEWPNFAREGGA